MRVRVNEHEIACLAMHLGAHLEAQAARRDRLSCTLVCPEHYELATTLRERLTAEFGQYLVVDRLVTRLEDVPEAVAAAGTGPDLVISTLDLEGLPDGAPVIRPLPGRRDFDRIRDEITRVTRRRAQQSDHRSLLDFLEPTLFFRDVTAEDETAMIRILGGHLIDAGVMDAAQVESVLERERLSSTAFSDGIAVPHAMTMAANRSAIALVVNSEPMAWGDKHVNVIALIAFSPNDRKTFWAAFEEFTEVLGERSAIQRLVRQATDYPAFVREIRALPGPLRARGRETRRRTEHPVRQTRRIPYGERAVRPLSPPGPAPRRRPAACRAA
ncbi:hypothetical protein GCM10010329_74760 [Streptomyces spiroverticillatus]|uniref:PTS EIIA type-2 domain-containing protein n=1 Tax=Streptomyces finlayi TaxID=67296 RepID=A0A918X6H8_9ACTN|nr:PTS sugar transporter subunit IIA [Streptomyces finlayi]GHA40643.1 hypothetical protein GCM10010329_74760 [Streptomyces spiroverticillatus]GHD15352.1 hypothetical protein GCM10010334_75310 [Streptomyces finlayi]